MGLDVPCRECGRPIYYNYKGPVEGLCGRCTDGSRKTARLRGSRRIALFQGRRRSRFIAALVVVALAFAAFVGYVIYRLL